MGDDTKEGIETGGEPQTVARCTNCGNVYPVQETSNGTLRPVGTGGACECGNTEFEVATDE